MNSIISETKSIKWDDPDGDYDGATIVFKQKKVEMTHGFRYGPTEVLVENELIEVDSVRADWLSDKLYDLAMDYVEQNT
jgi:hypothetical protein